MKRKRSLAIILSLVLLLGVCPLTGLASSDEPDAAQEEPAEDTAPAEDDILIEEDEITDALADEPTEPAAEPEITLESPAASSAVAASVQALIDALPSLDDYDAVEDEAALYKLNYDYWVARQSYEVLTEEERAQVDTAKLDELGDALLASTPMMLSTTYKQEAWSVQYLSGTVTRSWTDNAGNYRTAIINRISDHWIYDTDYGHACYCIRPDMGAADYYYYDTGTFAWYDQLDEGQRSLIRLILLYGYPNCSNTAGHGTYHNSAYCQAATQLLIFEAVSKCLNTSAPYLHSSTVWSDAIPYSSSRSSFYWIYWNILSRIQNDGWLPSWLKTSQAKADAAPIELSYNADTGLYEATVTNAAAKNTSADYYSHMLDDFSYALPAGVTVTRDGSVSDTAVGQKLTVTATAEALENGDDGNIQIAVTTPYMVKSSGKSSYPATVYLYGRQYSGDVWYQTMIQVQTVQTDPVMAYMTLHGEVTGDMKIIKTSDDGNVSGFTFTVTNNDTGETRTAVTGSDGTFLLEELKAGSYTVAEAVPTEYVSEQPSKTVTVKAGETATVDFLNCLKRFRLLVTKRDGSTGSYSSGTLAGTVYGVYHNGTLVDRYTTDGDGKFTTDYYPCGEGWTVREITPSQGYTLDGTSYPIGASPGEFTLAANTVEMTVLEMPVPGSITVQKTDSGGNPLSGVTYLLEYSTDAGKAWKTVFSRTGDDVAEGGCTSAGLANGTLTTVEDGIVTFSGLRADSHIRYRLTETAAQNGKTLLAGAVFQSGTRTAMCTPWRPRQRAARSP